MKAWYRFFSGVGGGGGEGGISDSGIEDLFFGASVDCEPSMFIGNYLFSLGFELILKKDPEQNASEKRKKEIGLYYAHVFLQHCSRPLSR